MDCVFTKIIDYNDNVIDFLVSKFSTIRDHNDNILDKIFPLSLIIIHGTPVRDAISVQFVEQF